MHYALALPTFLTLGHLRASSHAARLIGMLSILMVSALTMSCKDDDDKLSAEEQAEKEAAEQAEKASKFWNVAGQLVGTLQATDDYASKTYEPTIGEPQEGNSTVRLVVTDDAASAAQRFADLVGLDDGVMNSETATYAWSDPDVGTLTYTKSTDGQTLATVDVSIKQVPKLQKIIYLTLAQKGDNANYTTCYYRFGDVISRANEDGKTEYWVCVRPSFEPEGKGDSHWITLSPLPTKNIFTYTSKTNGFTYTLPKNLGVNKKHMQNLAEMLWALTDPQGWEKSITDNPYTSIFNKGVPMFNDFDKALVKYHSEEFWKRVNDGWVNTKVTLSKGPQVDLWQAILAKSRSEMSTALYNGGLHLLCDGYSWNTTFSNSPTLYEYTYKYGRKAESNCHNVTYTKPSAQVIYKNEPNRDIEINVAEEYTDVHPYLKIPRFFGNEDYHYIIRHATGDELSALTGTVYNKKRPIDGFTEVYNYNKRYGINKLSVEPEERDDITDTESVLDKPVVGCILGSDGKFYTTCAKAVKKSGEAAAVVVYVGDSNHPVETDTEYTGLAMALSRPTSVKWSATSSDIDCGLKAAYNMEELLPCLDGIHNTKQLAAGCGKEHDHPAAKKCADFKPKVGKEGLQTYDFSEWFIPAGGQWILAYKGLGMTWDDKVGPKIVSDNDLKAEREAAKQLLEKAGVEFSRYTSHLWTSTPFMDSDYRVNTFGLHYSYLLPYQGAYTDFPLVPFIAFKRAEP